MTATPRLPAVLAALALIAACNPEPDREPAPQGPIVLQAHAFSGQKADR